jgi:2-polyprenyl-3-methyl-5-hydroxy-6-metoxy-1,4-benzoquinol methylase
MATKQQDEALSYFREYAQDWGRKASAHELDQVNVIRQRNQVVLDVVRAKKDVAETLDIGCGTGELVCDTAAEGIHATGVDFSDEMITIAQSHAKKSSLKSAQFERCSIFDFQFKDNFYDVISANGFIEYISYDQLGQILKLCFRALKKGGSLVLGSRNRLFNLFSLNTFTEQEIADGNLIPLMTEAIAIVNGRTIQELIGSTKLPLQKEDMRHANTGVKVVTRYQFTPAQLATILDAQGFEPVEIYPIHTHGVSTTFKEKHPTIHGRIANLLQSVTPDNTTLIPQSSSFMIHARKK